MQRKRTGLIYVLMIFLILFTACSSPYPEQSKKFELTAEEHIWLEKFFRYFMLHETTIYTLAGSKPLTGMILCYEDTPKEQLREEKREDYLYFLLNRNNEKDMQFYEKLSPCQATSESDPPATLKSDPPPIFSLTTIAT